MPLESGEPIARDGDLAELVGLRHKHFIITLRAGARFETHRGVVQHDDLIGRPWGSQVFSHMGAPFFVLQPSLADVLVDLPVKFAWFASQMILCVRLTIGQTLTASIKCWASDWVSLGWNSQRKRRA